MDLETSEAWVGGGGGGWVRRGWVGVGVGVGVDPEGHRVRISFQISCSPMFNPPILYLA